MVTDGKGAAGDEDACGNDMEGVPYIEVSATQGGTPITWDNSDAGEVVSGGVLTGSLTVTTGWHGLQQLTAGVVENVELVNATSSGRGAVATVTVDGTGAVTAVTITKGGSGYADGDTLRLEAENGAGTDAADHCWQYQRD